MEDTRMPIPPEKEGKAPAYPVPEWVDDPAENENTGASASDEPATTEASPAEKDIPTDTADAPASDAPAEENAPLPAPQVQALAQELAALLAKQNEEPEPTEEEKKAAALAAKKARKLKARKRHRRAFRQLIIRLLVLIVVVYVLCFQLVGFTMMPSGDMYPRIDAGDLVMFYRLDKDVRAQDIIVFEKEASTLQEYVEPEEDETETEPTEPVEEPPVADPAATAAPTEAPALPPADEKTPAQIVADDGIMNKINRWIYDAEITLGLRRPEGKQMFICRVVATAGDTVEITDTGRLVVNGNTMIESNIFSETTAYVGFTEYPLTLHAGECFVMADHRNGGADSRFFGPVLQEEILGTVFTIVRRNNL